MQIHVLSNKISQVYSHKIQKYIVLSFNDRLFLVIRRWVKAAKLSIGCLMETRVQEGQFKKEVEATFPGWSYIQNYDHHRLGSIWVFWSEKVEVVHVTSSAQMITCWVRLKSSGDFFLGSYVYAFNDARERRALWQEMEMISSTVSGSTNPWIIEGDFNVALSM